MRAAVLAPLAFALMVSTARADEGSAGDRESARIAFAEGNKLRDEGNVRGALEKYKAAFSLAPTPVTALEVGRAEIDLGKLVEAREVLLAVAGMAPSKSESAKSQSARRESTAMASALASRIPRVMIRVTGMNDAVIVSVDGNAIPREALAAARSVNPGHHAITAIIAGHTAQQTLDLREGESRDVTLDVTSFTQGASSENPPFTNSSAPIVNGAATSGVVAFNAPDDDHGWTLRDPSGQAACKLPCAQSLGMTPGWTIARDDGQHVTVPPGLAVFPGSTAQIEAHAAGGNRVVGWTLVGVGSAACVAGIVITVIGIGGLDSTTGESSVGPFLGGLGVLGAGTIALTVGLFFLAASHDAILVRTDTGMPVRIAHQPQIHFSPFGAFGTF